MRSLQITLEKGIFRVEAGNQVPQTVLILFSEDITSRTAVVIGVIPWLSLQWSIVILQNPSDFTSKTVESNGFMIGLSPYSFQVSDGLNVSSFPVGGTLHHPYMGMPYRLGFTILVGNVRKFQGLRFNVVILLVALYVCSHDTSRNWVNKHKGRPWTNLVQSQSTWAKILPITSNHSPALIDSQSDILGPQELVNSEPMSRSLPKSGYLLLCNIQ